MRGSGKVSILARPFGRALLGSVALAGSHEGFNPRPPFRTGATPYQRNQKRQPKRFNPRPPFRTGATGAACTTGTAYIVSILARPFGRALRDVQ